MVLGKAVTWIQIQAVTLGLEHKLIQVGSGKNDVVILLTWKGRDPGLETILLYSHMDVVPVDKKVFICTYNKYK